MLRKKIEKKKMKILYWPDKTCKAVRSLVWAKLPMWRCFFLSLIFCIFCGSEFQRIEENMRNEFMYCVVRIGGRIRLRGLRVLYACLVADRGHRILVNGGRAGIEQLVWQTQTANFTSTPKGRPVQLRKQRWFRSIPRDTKDGAGCACLNPF